MPKFKYKAKKITGEETEGFREAVDRFELARDLRKEGYILILSGIEGKAGNKKNSILSAILAIFGRISLSEKMIFSRNLAVMLSAGLPISRALTALSRQTKNTKFQKVLAGLGADLQKGDPFSVALSRYPDVFSDLFAAMVGAGEKTGKLPETLNLISQQLERDLTLSRRVKGALMYPAVIIVAMVGIGILMMIFVVPTLIGVFKDLNVELPWSTRAIIYVSNLFINHGILMTLGVLILIGIIFWASRATKGKRLIDAVFLHIPFFSELIKKMNSSRTTRTLSSLLSSGVDVIEAFDVTKNVLQNNYYREVLNKAKAEIQKGSPIARVFIEAENLYPSLVGEMVAVGEETGQLPSMLLRLADFYEEEVGEITKNLTTIIEPILMIFIGAVVGFFAISMIQPMYSMMGGI